MILNIPYKNRNKKNTMLCFVALLLLSNIAYGAISISPGEMKRIPISKSTSIPSYAAIGNYSFFGMLTKEGLKNSLYCPSINYGNDLGWSSDRKVFGIKYSNDIIIGFEGSIGASFIPHNGTARVTGSWISSVSSNKVQQQSQSKSCPNYISGGFFDTSQGVLYPSYDTNAYISEINGEVILYAGPLAKTGTQTEVKAYISYPNSHQEIFLSQVKITTPRECTVSTDNTITFPPADVSDVKDGQVLTNKTGNLTVNCNDATNAPVTVEIQGPKGRYSDAMALTMQDGSDAPAEVRGFIGKDIPLTGQCNGRLDGYPGIVYFIPNAGMEKMTLTPGANKYNWVLCSKGQNKTGQATGSAKLILNWD